GKRDLFLASLERYSQAVMDPLLEPLESARASGREIRAFFDRVLELIRRPGGRRGCLVCNAAFELGSVDPAAARRVRRHFDRVRRRVAQPALSKQIRDLEREVGVKLFERLPRGARVTRAGEQFLSNARSALESATRAVSTARRTDSASGLKFAHSDLYVYTPVLVKLLAAFRQACPETPLRVVRVNEV